MEQIKSEIKLAGKLSGVDIKVRDICHDWILVTFDIPKNEQGDKIRQKFYNVARRLGAVMHTESCYLLPWCPETGDVLIDIASIGNCFVWLSTISDEEKAKEVTDQYDAGISEYIKEVKERINKMDEHLANNEVHLYNKMLKKTVRLITQLQDVARRRGSQKLIEIVDELASHINQSKVKKVETFNDLVTKYGVEL